MTCEEKTKCCSFEEVGDTTNVWQKEVVAYKFCGGVPTVMVAYHCKSVWPFLIQSVRGTLKIVVL